MAQEPSIEQDISRIWEIKGPPRVLIFTWLIIKNRIVTLTTWGENDRSFLNRCALCKRQEETVMHLFGTCQYTTRIRMAIASTSIQLSQCNFYSTGQFKQLIMNSQHTTVRQMEITICFVIYRERCHRIFRDLEKSRQLIQEEIMQEFRYWFTVQ